MQARFGGVRICWNKQVRTDLIDQAVWKEVCKLLEDPTRLEQEYRQRLLTTNVSPELGGLEASRGRLRQGIVRLIDSYAEGTIDKAEFDPRITRMRERIAQLEEQIQHIQDQASMERELQVILGQLETFAERVKEGLQEADWFTRRDIIRALVKRVEIDQEQVHVIFRIGPHTPSNPSNTLTPSSQHCRGRDDATLGRAFFCRVQTAAFYVSRFEPLLENGLFHRNMGEQPFVRDSVKARAYLPPRPIGHGRFYRVR